MSDNNGNVLSQAITGGGATRTQSYVYDPVNRLKSVTESGSQAWSQKYVYDAYGNRAIKSGSWIPTSGLTPQVGGQTHEDPAGVAALFPDNRWAAAGTDGSGNLTSFAGRTFVYDGENRLVSATVNGATAAYAYDGEGRRVRKTDAFGTTTFVYDAAGQLAAEYFAAAPNTTQPAEQEPGTRWVFADHLGSTRATLGSGGAGLKLFDYAPFGEDLARGHNGRGPEYPAGLDVPGNVAQRFTGKERDAETGLDYFGARYLASAQGRFTSPDAPFADQFPENPQSWNLYSYTRNNPLRYVDDDGRGVKEGVAKWVDRTGFAFVSLVLQPEKTIPAAASGIWNAVTNPSATLSAIGTGLQNFANASLDDKVTTLTEVGLDIGTAALTGGASRGTSLTTVGTIEVEGAVAKQSLTAIAGEIRQAGTHPAAVNNRTIAVGENAQGQLFAGSSNGFDRGQRAAAQSRGVTCVSCKKGAHAEENLMREVPGLRRVGTSKRSPCGPSEHNCAGQLADRGIEVENK